MPSDCEIAESVCRVRQVEPTDDATSARSGWYVRSDQACCGQDSPGTIGYTEGAEPAPGSDVTVRCLTRRSEGCGDER